MHAALITSDHPDCRLTPSNRLDNIIVAEERSKRFFRPNRCSGTKKIGGKLERRFMSSSMLGQAQDHSEKASTHVMTAFTTVIPTPISFAFAAASSPPLSSTLPRIPVL
jgi:hypothetical protein